jgi:D-lactate dehydrogenase (cytochrome)
MSSHIIQSVSPALSPLDKEKAPLLKKTDSNEFSEFLQDASRMSGGYASAIVFPKTELQISEYLKKINEIKTPVTISGNRTGLVGGAIPMGGEILATSLLTKTFPQGNEEILEIVTGEDEYTRTPYQFFIKKIREEIIAVVPPGLRLGEFQKRVEEKGWFYPPDPTEWNAFLGGTVSTNASGARTFKYGATRPFVRGLRTVLANGDVLDIQRNMFSLDSKHQFQIMLSGQKSAVLNIPSVRMPKVKNAAGYFCMSGMDFIDLWMGSEGTLGVISQAELRLIPKPVSVMSGIAFFPSEQEAIQFVEDIREKTYETWRLKKEGIDFRALEYFDSQSLTLMRSDKMEVRIPGKAQAAIYFEQESIAKIARPELENFIVFLLDDTVLKEVPVEKEYSHPFCRMMRLLKERNILEDSEIGFPEEEKAQKRLKEFRHALPVKVNERIGHLRKTSGLSRLHKIGTDTSVPDSHLAEMVRHYHDILDASGIEYVIFGHIGNNHLHANLLPKSESEFIKAKQIYLQFCRYAVQAGGSVSAEHGVGKLKIPSFEIQYTAEERDQMLNLKKALDPNLILGRGNLFKQ